MQKKACLESLALGTGRGGHFLTEVGATLQLVRDGDPVALGVEEEAVVPAVGRRIRAQAAEVL